MKKIKRLHIFNKLIFKYVSAVFVLSKCSRKQLKMCIMLYIMCISVRLYVCFIK